MSPGPSAPRSDLPPNSPRGVDCHIGKIDLLEARMATVEEVSTTLIDDLDGTEAMETVSFALDGKSFEIDLSKENANKLRSALRPFVQHARGSQRRRRARARGTVQKGRSGFDPAEVRAWAKSKRIKIAPRGRIAADVVEKWRAATQK